MSRRSTRRITANLGPEWSGSPLHNSETRSPVSTHVQIHFGTVIATLFRIIFSCLKRYYKLKYYVVQLKVAIFEIIVKGC